MSHFSVKEAISFSFSIYRKHFVLLATASVIIASVLSGCSASLDRIARQSGLSTALDTAALVKKQGYSGTVQSLGTETLTLLKAVPLHSYISLVMIFILGYAFFFFLMLGYLHICLALKDTEHASLKLLFVSSFSQVKRFIGAAILYGLGMMAGCLGALFLTVLISMMGRFFLSEKTMLLITPVLCISFMLVMFGWLMGYIFFGFCLLDEPTSSSWEALQTSGSLSTGFRSRIVKTFGALFGVVIIPLVLVLAMIMAGGKLLAVGDMRMATFIHFISIIVTYPFFSLASAYVYRSLTKTK